MSLKWFWSIITAVVIILAFALQFYNKMTYDSCRSEVIAKAATVTELDMSKICR